MSDHARLALHDVSGSLQDLLQKLEGDQGPIWANAFKRFLRKENPWQNNLSYNGNVDFPARSESFTAKDYFQIRSGVFVWDGFKNRILRTAVKADSTPATSLACFDLVKDTPDEQIRAELPEDHVFQDASVFCSHLAGMIDRQPNGKEGSLLNDGYANVFYVQGSYEVVAVSVHWVADFRGWSVCACELDVSAWPAGYRAFSATAVA